MTSVAATSQSLGVVNMATGAFTGDGAVADALCGFVPRRVEVTNVTDQISYLWQEGMAATTTLKTVAAGTRTADTGSAILAKGANKADTYAGFQVPAAVSLSGKAIVWTAWG